VWQLVKDVFAIASLSARLKGDDMRLRSRWRAGVASANVKATK
jgi:hypothetical protein